VSAENPAHPIEAAFNASCKTQQEEAKRPLVRAVAVAAREVGGVVVVVERRAR
jgi:hypothetical protein